MIIFDAVINLLFAGLCVFELSVVGFNVGTMVGLISTSIISLWAMSILLRAELIWARGGKHVVMHYFFFSWYTLLISFHYTLVTTGNGIELYISLAMAYRNLEPMFPYENDFLAYFQVSRIFCVAIVFLRLIFCVPVRYYSYKFYTASYRYFYVLSNRILYKSKMDDATVQDRKKRRFEENVHEKRQEKNLNTVIESVNETEHNKTSMKDRSSSKTGYRPYMSSKMQAIDEGTEQPNVGMLSINSLEEFTILPKTLMQ